MKSSENPIVFTGPSASAEDIRWILPQARVCQPVARDDLYRAREEGASVFLIIDGVFMHQLAISPREVVEVAQDGGLIYGASSMGALRAAECWPAGVRGVGLIAHMFRHGVLESDDEVAVATDPDNGHAALSVALVNIRYAVRKTARKGIIDVSTAKAIVDVARQLHFADRQWSEILQKAGIANHGSLEEMLRPYDLKRWDALRAARILRVAFDRSPGLVAAHCSGGTREFAYPTRYPGFDRWFGLDLKQGQILLAKWLFGTGRYQPYVWPLAARDPVFQSISPATGSLGEAEGARDRLATMLSIRLEELDSFAQRLCEELEFVDELGAELMRWYAVHKLSTERLNVSDVITARVREEVAIAHGCPDWRTLTEEVVDDRLFGAIPFSWIDEACRQLSLARSVVVQRM